MTQGTRSKREHRVTYPPFSFLVHFVLREADDRNDPGFIFSPHPMANFKKERSDGYQRPVSVHKTYVSSTDAKFKPDSTSKTTSLPDRMSHSSQTSPFEEM